ncbi:MAG TPA: CDP-alcohol phosphatidyltransferase family protein [Acidimicrobiales bacterium]|nr:CDP-alcohol phosphatidyltransferase family protein [Acidimicrobiales bacterium]
MSGDRHPPQLATFGPSALATPANAITAARLAATPAIIAMVALSGPGWAPFAVAFAIGSTDGVDGWLARRQGTTRSGAFLDPLADKVAVVGILCAIAARHEVSWVPVALIAAREVSMSVYRVVMGRRGVSIPARASAKVKTLVQGLSILLCLAPPVARHGAVLQVALWSAVVLTLATGVQYVLDGHGAGRGGKDAESQSGGAPPGLDVGAVGEATG